MTEISVGKMLVLYKCEDLNSDPQHHVKAGHGSTRM